MKNRKESDIKNDESVWVDTFVMRLNTMKPFQGFTIYDKLFSFLDVFMNQLHFMHIYIHVLQLV